MNDARSASTGTEDANGGNAPSLLIGLRDAAKLLGIGSRTLWQLSKDEKIPTCMVGTRRMFSRASLIAWIQTRETGGAK